jgi:predicted DsbA family dithiol-disulfide isomerase
LGNKANEQKSYQLFQKIQGGELKRGNAINPITTEKVDSNLRTEPKSVESVKQQRMATKAQEAVERTSVEEMRKYGVDVGDDDEQRRSSTTTSDHAVRLTRRTGPNQPNTAKHWYYH